LIRSSNHDAIVRSGTTKVDAKSFFQTGIADPSGSFSLYCREYCLLEWSWLIFFCVTSFYTTKITLLVFKLVIGRVKPGLMFVYVQS
jgi:hypothetical protein